jgi:hypothetical protein
MTEYLISAAAAVGFMSMIAVGVCCGVLMARPFLREEPEDLPEDEEPPDHQRQDISQNNDIR